MVNQGALTNLRITTINQIEELLKEHDRVATVWCTGLGKSRYLIYPLCQRLPGKKLILEPNTEIINYLVDLSIEECNGQFITYQSLLHKNIDDLVETFSKFNYIFLDEVHRALAEKWGKVLNLIFEALDKLSKTIKILGFTATEVRMDNRNVIEEIFNNIQTKPIGLIEAIQENYLPNPEYHCGLYEITTKEKERILKLNDEPLKNQILNYDIDESIENIFKENLDFNQNHKIICFVDKISNIDEGIVNVKKWIKKDINIYKLHSKQSRLLNKKQIEKFQNTKGINIIFAVNMLNEGVHFPGTDCIIFLRKTSSNIIYSQQLGRVLGDNVENPKVFDLVNNINNLNSSYAQLVSDRADELKIKPEKVKTKNGEALKIITHQVELINILKSSYKIDWSKEEDQVIIDNYYNKTNKEVSELLENRTLFATKQRIRYLLKEGVIESKESREITRWTNEEESFLINNQESMTDKEIGEKLGINVYTVSHKRSKLIEKGILMPKSTNNHSTHYNEEEDQTIIDNYEKLTFKEIGKLLNRSVASVSGRIAELKKKDIISSKKNSLYTREEDELVLNPPEGITDKQLGELLNRSNKSIVSRRSYLKLKKGKINNGTKSNN